MGIGSQSLPAVVDSAIDVEANEIGPLAEVPAGTPMLSECMRQIFDAERGPELIGASRLARALARQSRFDELVIDHQPKPLLRRTPRA